jgi:dienelactone hydrolase
MPPPRLSRLLAAALPVLVAAAPLAAVELDPIGPGPYAVASTNLEVTPRAGVPMFDFLNGKATARGTEYLTDILAHPAAVPTLTITVPDDPARFGAQAGVRLPVVLCLFYPTSRDNPRPDYAFPYRDTGDRVFPHMQRPGEKPIFADPAARYPLIVVSGGYNTHALWHLEHLKMLASHGYIVADPQHGDGRGATFQGNLALRPIELRATIDYLLHDPDFGPAIDAARIGAAGQSAGGHTVLAALGGTDPDGRIPDAADPRIKAGFGLVPFMGGSIGVWPFKFDAWYFGRDYAGLRRVRVPFFAVYGQKDRNVPPAGVEAGVRALAGPAAAVMLDGETHRLSPAAPSDGYTWEILFFDTWLRGDAGARRKLYSGTSVRGGVNDHKTIQHGAAGVR